MNRTFKFTLTQISALIPFIIGLSIALEFFRNFVMTEGKPDGFSFFTFGVFVCIMMGSVFILFKAWARLLVILKILTKEEAAGYPYSKPWERNKE